MNYFTITYLGTRVGSGDQDKEKAKVNLLLSRRLFNLTKISSL